jgi:hypothetical protein
MPNDLIEYTPPALLTEREVRLAGATSNRLCNLRGALKDVTTGGSLVVTTRNGSSSMNLTSIDMEALLGLLIERDEQFLTSLNIELEK